MQITGIKEAFKLFDQDGDGYITKTELQEVMERFEPKGILEEEIKDLVNELDRNGDGKIDVWEFGAAINEEIDLRNAFDAFDEMNLGFITKPQLKTAMEKLGEELTDDEIELMYKEVDLNGDGVITFDEFQKMMEE